MRWLNNMNETIKRGICTWLNVVPASGNCIQINEVLDFEANAIRNRIWYRGDGNELEQMYQQARSMRINISSGPANAPRVWRCARYIPVCLG